jgi:hypothetical protein
MVMTKFLSDSQEISWPRYFRHRLAKAVGNFAPSALYYLSDKYNVITHPLAKACGL